jgi:tetratricopeptide (TPR) repeat protein
MPCKLLAILVILAPALARTEARAEESSIARHLAVGDEAFQSGRFAEAETEYQKALSAAEADRPAARAECLFRLARVHNQRGAFGRADRCCARALLLCQPTPQGDLDVARCWLVRADTYRRLGLYHAAAAAAQRSLEIREKILGKDHPEVAESLEALGRIFLEAPREAEIVKKNSKVTEITSRMPDVIEAARSIREKTGGKDLPGEIANHLWWASYYLRGWASEEHCQKAEKYIQEAEALARKIPRAEHPSLAECLALRASILRHREKYAEAATTQRQAVALFKKCFGPSHDQVGIALRGFASIKYLEGRHSEAEELFAQALPCRFAGLHDAELCRFFASAALERRRRYEEGETVYQAYLTEMARRGGATIESCLQQHDATLRRDYRRQWAYAEAHGWLSAQSRSVGRALPYPDVSLANLEAFTALRRVQKKPDPVQIVVKGPAALETVFPEQPTFKVSLRNTDDQEVGFTQGGDYRGGRQARWYFLVHDARKQRLPRYEWHDPVGGGIYSRSALTPKKGWNTTLDMRCFVEVPEPGTYEVRILYHDSFTLADTIDYQESELITCRSPVLKLTVKRRKIVLTPAERRAIRKSLDGLDEKGDIKLVAGTYGEWAHKLVPPSSPPGAILGHDWKAVPVLLEELGNDRISDKKRAWILALLFSVTGRNDPRGVFNSDVLGAYECQEGGWRIAGGQDDDEESSVGIGFGSTHRANGRIDPKAQRKFAQVWKGWERHLDVQAPDPKARDK